jgi:hypothetical protein
MQMIPFLPNHQQFDPEVLRSMSVAYQVNSEASVLLEFWTVLICGTAPVFHLVQTHLDNVRQFSARLDFVRQGGMTVPKNDTYKDYVRYAEHCLNMVATTTDQESRSIQRARSLEAQGPVHYCPKEWLNDGWLDKPKGR